MLKSRTRTKPMLELARVFARMQAQVVTGARWLFGQMNLLNFSVHCRRKAVQFLVMGAMPKFRVSNSSMPELAGFHWPQKMVSRVRCCLTLPTLSSMVVRTMAAIARQATAMHSCSRMAEMLGKFFLPIHRQLSIFTNPRLRVLTPILICRQRTRFRLREHSMSTQMERVLGR